MLTGPSQCPPLLLPKGWHALPSPLAHPFSTCLLESPYHPVGRLWSPFPEKVQEEAKAAGEEAKQTRALWNHVSLTHPHLDLGPTHTPQKYSHNVKGLQAWENQVLIWPPSLDSYETS